MGWVRIDDAFYDHPKFIAAGPAGISLWVTALAWSNRNLTNGYIPERQVVRLLDFAGMSEEIGGVKGLFAVGEDLTAEDLAKRLVHLGIFDDVDGGGYLIHDYLEYQPSAEQVTAKREKERNRWQQRASDHSDETPRQLRGNSAATPPASQPQPQPPKDQEKKRSRPTETFSTTERHAQFCVEHGLALEQERAHWLEWCEAHGKTFVSQNAGFATWLRQAVAFGRGGRPVVTLEELAEPAHAFDRSPWVCSAGNPECVDGWVDLWSESERRSVVANCGCRVKASSG